MLGQRPRMVLIADASAVPQAAAGHAANASLTSPPLSPCAGLITWTTPIDHGLLVPAVLNRTAERRNVLSDPPAAARSP